MSERQALHVYLSVGAQDDLPAERQTGRTKLSSPCPGCDDTVEHLQVKDQQSDAPQLHKRLTVKFRHR